MSISKFDLLQDNIDLSAILGKSQQYSIYFIGGKSDQDTRIYSMDSKMWTTERNLSIDKADFATIPYKENKYLILGGRINSTGFDNISDVIIPLIISGLFKF